jgi:hypothetical protein
VASVRRNLHRGRAIAGLGAAALVALALPPGCSVDQGTGCASGTLNILNCWSGSFDLRPNFFAVSASTAGSLLIRIQNGADYESFSDGIAFEVDDIGAIRGDPLPDGTPQPSLLCPCPANSNQCPPPCPACAHRLVVGLAPAISPTGTVVQRTPNSSVVHATLYLQHTCRTQNLALYATDAVSLNPDGTCLPSEAGTSQSACAAPATVAMDASIDASTASPDGAPPAAAASTVGTSTIVFHALFDGDTNESNAQQRLSYADFDLYFADPSEICAGGPPPPCRGHLTGSFSFYFERGRPAQPFP